MSAVVTKIDNFCGYLVKQGGAQGGFKSWKQRWFVIHDNKQSYYKDESCKEQCGSLNLSDSVVLDCTAFDEHDYLAPADNEKVSSARSRATDESIASAFQRMSSNQLNCTPLTRHNTLTLKNLDNASHCKECGAAFSSFAKLTKNPVKKTACRRCQFNFCRNCQYERLQCSVCNDEDASDQHVRMKYEYTDNPLFNSVLEKEQPSLIDITNSKNYHTTANTNNNNNNKPDNYDNQAQFSRAPQKRHAKVHYPTLSSQAVDNSRSSNNNNSAHVVKLDIDARNVISLRHSLQLNVLLRNTVVPHIRVDLPANVRKNLFAVCCGSRTLWLSCPSVDAKKSWICQIHNCARDDAYIANNWPKLIWPRIHEIEIASVIETSRVKSNPLQEYNLITMNNPFDITKLGLVTTIFGQAEPGSTNLQCIIDAPYMAELARQEHEALPTKTTIVSNVIEIKANSMVRRQSVPMYISNSILEESTSQDASLEEELLDVDVGVLNMNLKGDHIAESSAGSSQDTVQSDLPNKNNNNNNNNAHNIGVKAHRNIAVYPTMSMQSELTPVDTPQPLLETQSPSIVHGTPAQSARFAKSFLAPGSLALGPKVGGGAYGDVYKGFLWGTRVAAKTLKHETKQVPFRWVDKGGIAMIALSAAIVPILHAIKYWQPMEATATRQQGDDSNSNYSSNSSNPVSFDASFTPQRRASVLRQRSVYSTISSKYNTLVPNMLVDKKQLMNLAAIPANAIQLGITPDHAVLCVDGEQVLLEISANSCQSDILDDQCKEINILSQLRHPNVVLFMGVTIDIPLHLINTHAHQFYVAKVKKMNLVALSRATSIAPIDQTQLEDEQAETNHAESIFLYIRDDLVYNKKSFDPATRTGDTPTGPSDVHKPHLVPSEMTYSPINPAESVGICLITEWCELGSLFDIIYDFTIPLSSKQCLEIAMGVAQGLNYLHKLQPKIVHRDVKSQNILMDSYFNVKVTDFGLSFNSDAKLASDDAFHGVFGTPEWLAPEMIVGMSYNEKIDIYSYGVLLTEIFARQQPYVDILPNVSYETVSEGVILNGIQPTIPTWAKGLIGNMISNCLQRDPKSRMNFDQIIMELHALLNLPDITFLLEYDMPRVLELLNCRRNRMLQSLAARELAQLCASKKVYVELDLGQPVGNDHGNDLTKSLNSQQYSCCREEVVYSSTDAGRFLNRYSRIQYQQYKEAMALGDRVVDEKEAQMKAHAAAQEQIRIEAYNTLTGDSKVKQSILRERIQEKNQAHTPLRHEELQVRMLDDDLVHIQGLLCADLTSANLDCNVGSDIDFDTVAWVLSYLECLWGLLAVARPRGSREWCCEFVTEEGTLLPLMVLARLRLDNEVQFSEELEGLNRDIENLEVVQREAGYNVERHHTIQDLSLKAEYLTHLFRLYDRVRATASDLLLLLLRNIPLENVPRLVGGVSSELLQTVSDTVDLANERLLAQALAQQPNAQQINSLRLVLQALRQ